MANALALVIYSLFQRLLLDDKNFLCRSDEAYGNISIKHPTNGRRASTHAGTIFVVLKKSRPALRQRFVLSKCRRVLCFFQLRAEGSGRVYGR